MRGYLEAPARTDRADRPKLLPLQPDGRGPAFDELFDLIWCRIRGEVDVRVLRGESLTTRTTRNRVPYRPPTI